MQKKLIKDEIDLIDVILKIWNKKFQVAIFILISIAVVFISQKIQKQEKLIVNSITEVRPISVYDQTRYDVYNSVIKSVVPNYYYQIQERIEKNGVEYKIEKKLHDLSINNINKDYLLDLFCDSFDDKSHLISLIKEYNYVNEENYSSKIDYEQAVIKTASSINLIKDNKKNKIFILSDNINEDKWENFLEFAEKKSNLQIQENLGKIFSDYLDYLEVLHDFETQDMRTKLSITQDEREKIKLEEEINIQIASNFIGRMKDLFDSSPMSNIDKFYAAKIDYNSIKYEIKNNGKSNLHKLIVAGICGAIFGIFFVLISTGIQNRK